MDYSLQTVLNQFQSNFVDPTLFAERIGGAKDDADAVRRYLELPLVARPEIAPFFDRNFYLQANPDIRSGGVDPLVHFIGWGITELRAPHPLIDPRFMIRGNPGILPTPPTADALWEVLRADIADPSPFFSLDYYRNQIDESEQVPDGLLRHFLDLGLLRGLRPGHGFDPISYYRHTDDKTFDIRSGLRHMALHGNTLPSAIAYPPNEDETKLLLRARAEALVPRYAREPLRFDTVGIPELSVIIVAHDNFALTLQTLASVRTNYPGNIQIILIDSGSSDDIRNISRYVTGVNIVRFASNVSFVRGCNAALEWVEAETVLLLNNDVELAVGAIDAALRRLRSDPRIGAVGAKVLRSHARLQEAGCIVWRNGWTIGYLRDESPLVPEANFVRDVDFCSAVFLLTRTDVARRLNGFDVAFAPAYFEDADLCLRIRDAGYRIVYDPSVVVHHLEYGTSGGAQEAWARIRAAHATFFQKHRSRLGGFHVADRRAQVFARSTTRPRGRVLFIEDQLPLRHLGSGFVRSNDIIRVIAELGYHVTVFPIARQDHEVAAVYLDFPDTVEVMHDRSFEELEAFLRDRRGYYDTIWLARTHNLRLVKPLLEEGGFDLLGGIRVVLDTEAITAAREARRVELTTGSATFDLGQAIEEEFADAHFCQKIVAVNNQEAGLIETFGFHHVAVLGHLRPLRLTPRPWARRAGMLLVGAFLTRESPNYDSLCWFVDMVLPLIERELGHETRLTVAGVVGEGVDFDRFQDHARITVMGVVPDLTPLYDSSRVFVAPTRFAAGIPHKIHEAASYGLPVVATELLRQQLGWENGRDLLAANATDPEAFARRVLDIYRSEETWNGLREGAAQRIASECGRAEYEQRVSEILAS